MLEKINHEAVFRDSFGNVLEKTNIKAGSTTEVYDLLLKEKKYNRGCWYVYTNNRLKMTYHVG